MNTNFTIKNFRVFDENGVSVELKPITILTGCNSSGKSSIARAMLLLNSFLSQIRKAIENDEPIELDKYKIDFTTYPNNQLGRYDRIVHEESNSHSITMAYTTYSLMLSKEVEIELVFDSNKNDELNNAYLQSITIKVGEDVFYSSNKNGKFTCNLNTIKDSCCDFLLIEQLAHNYCGLEGAYDLERKISKKNYEAQHDDIITALNDFDNQRKHDVYKYVRTTHAKNSIYSRCKADADIIIWTRENDSFFMIPVIQWLDTLSKEELLSAVQAKLLNNATKLMVTTSEKVVADYIASSFSSFSEYIKQFEKDYFNNVNVHTSHQKSPCVLDPNDLRFITNYFYGQDLIDNSKPVPLEDLDMLQNCPRRLENPKDVFKDKDKFFYVLYELLMLWNDNFTSDNSIFYTKKTEIYGATYFKHMMYTLLTTYATEVMCEVLCPDWSGNMEYVSSTRVDVKRLYSLEINYDFATLLKRYFDKKREFLDYKERVNTTDKHNYKIGSFTNYWIQKFGIGHSLLLSVDKEGLGAQIRLRKKADEDGRLLADEGYGITQLVSILLQIETAILSANGVKVNRYWGLSDLDHYDDRKFQYEINTIVVEEPEIHLHPKYQSILADMFVEACQTYNIHFVIETHSEYIIRKLQLLVSGHVENVKADLSSVSIYYINSNEDKSKQKVKRIGICRDGYLDDLFGEGFYDEATRLSRMLM